MLGVSVTSLASQGPAPASMLHQESFRRFPVIFVVFDELPQASLMNMRGGIDKGLFPNFARLARSSTWFRNTSTVKGFTKEALPALLTGRYPETEGTRAVPQPPRSIFTMLGDAYDIRTVDRLPAVCPRRLCWPIEDPVGVTDGFSAFGSSERGSHFFSFLDLVEPRDHQPRLYFLHLVMPHAPWRYLPTGQRYPEADPMPGENDPPGRGKGWRGDSWLVSQGLQRHLLQTQLADRLLGALLDKLEKKGLYDGSLVVVAADHGVGFVPGRTQRLVRDDTIGHVAEPPLFIKRPLQKRGRVSDIPAEIVDVVPTIADVLNLSATWSGMDGTSLFHGSVTKDRRRSIDGLPISPRGVEKHELVFQKYSTFGFGRRHLDLFELAPGRREHLLGRSVDELSLARPGSGTVEIARLPALQYSSPSADVFPALLEGTVRDDANAQRGVLAVAVNQRVVAVTRTYREAGKMRFYCMLSPSFFGAARNEIEVFEVRGTGPESLAPLRVVWVAGG